VVRNINDRTTVEDLIFSRDSPAMRRRGIRVNRLRLVIVVGPSGLISGRPFEKHRDPGVRLDLPFFLVDTSGNTWGLNNCRTNCPSPGRPLAQPLKKWEDLFVLRTFAHIPAPDHNIISNTGSYGRGSRNRQRVITDGRNQRAKYQHEGRGTNSFHH
jgi:hypothetical protein